MNQVPVPMIHGMIVPVSIVSTDGFLPLRKCISKENYKEWFSNYAIRPAKLFDGAEKRLTIFLLSPSSETAAYSSRFHRWYSEERPNLLKVLNYTSLPSNAQYLDTFPKIGNDKSISIWNKLLKEKPMKTNFVRYSEHVVYHTRKLGYYVQFLDVPPLIYNEDGSDRETSELKQIYFADDDNRYAAIAVYLSTTFFWFFNTLSDCRNLNKREVDYFPFDMNSLPTNVKRSFVELGKKILDDLQKNSYFMEVNYKKLGKLSLQIFQPKTTIPISHKIDKVLAKHYGFTEEELDFIINYDIKYRMGDELGEESNSDPQPEKPQPAKQRQKPVEQIMEPKDNMLTMIVGKETIERIKSGEKTRRIAR